MTRKEWEGLAWKRRREFVLLAEKLGNAHWLTKSMGCLAWGRNDAESGPGATAQNAIYECGYLAGMRTMLVRLCDLKNDNAARNLVVRMLSTTYSTKI